MKSSFFIEGAELVGSHSALKHFKKLMTPITCDFAWLCAVLMVPLMLFIWALDTKKIRINRYRSYGWSWSKIAKIYGVAPTTARLCAMA